MLACFIWASVFLMWICVLKNLAVTADMVLLEEKQAFVFEFKVVNSAAGKDKAVTAAIKQIKEKGYAKKYMEQEQDQKIEAVYAIALVFGKKEKNVVGWKAKALLS